MLGLVSDLPVNIDSTYADDGSDPSVQLHQEHHDALHALYNSLLGATPTRAVDEITITLHGGGSAITAGLEGWKRVPWDCTITANLLLADVSGSIVVDIWKDSVANYPPTDADSITASAPPTLSSALTSTDSTLTGWTTALSAGDILLFHVDSAATLTQVTLDLIVTKT